MIHLIHNATRHRYDPALFGILRGQPEELTHTQLLTHIVRFTGDRGLSHYGHEERMVWLDATNTDLRALLGLAAGESTERFVVWDDGQRVSGWREIVERVHARWVVAEPHQSENYQSEQEWEQQVLQPG